MGTSNELYDSVDWTGGHIVSPQVFYADDDDGYEIIDRKSGEKVRDQTFYADGDYEIVSVRGD